MKLRNVLLASLGAVLLPVVASASTVTISQGEIGKSFGLTLGSGLFTVYTNGLPSGANTSLFLFDAAWHPLVWNDNTISDYTSGPCPGDTSPDPSPCGGASGDASFIWYSQTGGSYHLVVAESNAIPVDGAGNLLFAETRNGYDCTYFLPDYPNSGGSCLAAPGMGDVAWGGLFSNGGGADGNGYNATFNLGASLNKVEFSPTGNPEALPTPEPTSMILFGTGAMGLVAKLRRRKNQK